MTAWKIFRIFVKKMGKGHKQTAQHILLKANAKRNGDFFICLTCGIKFYRSKSRIKTGENKYCSKVCYQGSETNRKEKPHISNIRKLSIGEKNPSWKGGVTPKNTKIRNSAQYRKWRIYVFERDDYTCRHCGFVSKRGKYAQIHAHHIKEFAKYKEVRFDINNGITLCKDCHQLEHNNKF